MFCTENNGLWDALEDRPSEVYDAMRVDRFGGEIQSETSGHALEAVIV